ncbi:MAG: hypothetical protein HYW88_02030 [Candidatus Sungbacteria bacterium]|nr:hypothetical protein [Candidatus Sungbacteria bacterium]
MLGITNFAYGTGPYLRTTELLIAFNDVLESRGKKRISFVIPLVYGDRQKQVMREEFGAHAEKYPEEILLDARFGTILKSIFYGDSTYEDALKKWTEHEVDVSREARDHLSGICEVETLGGVKKEANGKDIAIELNRSPRIRLGVAPSYSTSFGYISQILKESIEVGRGTVNVPPALLEKGAEVARAIEESQKINAMAYPATFSWQENYATRYPTEVLVPPITSLPHGDSGGISEKGIYVTITGIPGLERLYEEARKIGLKLYSNDTNAVKGSVKALPHVVQNEKIIFQFARSGWGSVWLSLFSGTPIVVPEHDPTDDPEIFFNNRAVEALGVGMVYRGEPLSEIIRKCGGMRANCLRAKENILARFGAIDGNKECAKLFANDFLKNSVA